jgi:hypothetical protein
MNTNDMTARDPQDVLSREQFLYVEERANRLANDLEARFSRKSGDYPKLYAAACRCAARELNAAATRSELP